MSAYKRAIISNPGFEDIISTDNTAASSDLTGASDIKKPLLNYGPDTIRDEGAPVYIAASCEPVASPGIAGTPVGGIIPSQWGDTSTWIRVVWSSEGKGEQEVIFDAYGGGVIAVAASSILVEAILRGRGAFKFRAMGCSPQSLGQSRLTYTLKIPVIVGGAEVVQPIPRWAYQANIALLRNGSADYTTASSQFGAPAPPSGFQTNVLTALPSRTDDGTAPLYQIPLGGLDRVWRFRNTGAPAANPQAAVISYLLRPGF